MIPTTSWEPSARDLAWQKTFVDKLANGAVWGVPGTRSAFKFDKVRETFCLLDGDPTEEGNRRIAKALRLIGYTEVSKPGEAHASSDDTAD